MTIQPSPPTVINLPEQTFTYSKSDVDDAVYNPPDSNPDVLAQKEGQGHIEGQDVQEFARGIFQQRTLPENHRSEGANRAGHELGLALATEGAAFVVGWGLRSLGAAVQSGRIPIFLPTGAGGAGGFVRFGRRAAEGAGTFARELVPADLGLGEEAQFIGRIAGEQGGVANVAVDWVGGEMGNSGMAALARLKDIARDEGAASIRIQTSRVVEITGVLRKWLTSRGFQSLEDGTMLYEGPL